MSDDTILTEMIETAAMEQQRRLEKELLGAWRAGYDYVHYYVERATPNDDYSFSTYVFPSNYSRRPDPEHLRYLETFDLRGITREEIDRALQATDREEDDARDE